MVAAVGLKHQYQFKFISISNKMLQYPYFTPLFWYTTLYLSIDTLPNLNKWATADSRGRPALPAPACHKGRTARDAWESRQQPGPFSWVPDRRELSFRRTAELSVSPPANAVNSQQGPGDCWQGAYRMPACPQTQSSPVRDSLSETATRTLG